MVCVWFVCGLCVVVCGLCMVVHGCVWLCVLCVDVCVVCGLCTCVAYVTYNTVMKDWSVSGSLFSSLAIPCITSFNL